MAGTRLKVFISMWRRERERGQRLLSNPVPFLRGDLTDDTASLNSHSCTVLKEGFGLSHE
jgi:hypothetical protein